MAHSWYFPPRRPTCPISLTSAPHCTFLAHKGSPSDPSYVASLFQRHRLDVYSTSSSASSSSALPAGLASVRRGQRQLLSVSAPRPVAFPHTLVVASAKSHWVASITSAIWTPRMVNERMIRLTAATMAVIRMAKPTGSRKRTQMLPRPPKTRLRHRLQTHPVKVLCAKRWLHSH